jgi:carboxymethylenebutenolidase
MSSLRTLIGCVVATGTLTACQVRQMRPMSHDEHADHMAAGDLVEHAAAPSAQQGDLKYPASSIHAAARLASSPRHGEWVRVPWEPGSKDSIQAWIVYPTNSNAKAPVVVVIHEIYGLSTWVRAVADQAAADGFIGIAPDLNSRVRGGPSMDSLTADSANKLSKLVTPAERNRAIAAVARYAMSQPSAIARYGVIGFCYGGGTVWYQAINEGIPGYSGGVAFYGAPYLKAGAPDPDSLAKVNKPIMMFNGAKDARTGSSMPAIDSMMKAMGKWYYGTNFPGAVHGFMRAQDDPKATRDEAEEQANLAAVHDSWPRTVEFLKKNLGGK